MIDFHTYQQIHYLFKEAKLRKKQIADKLGLDPDTVSAWLARERYGFSKKRARRKSKLDPYTPGLSLGRWLATNRAGGVLARVVVGTARRRRERRERIPSSLRGRRENWRLPLSPVI